MDRNELPLEPCHLGVPSGVSKTICEPMVCLAQSVHLSCTDTNTISKQTKIRFHMTTSPRRSIGCVQKQFLSPLGETVHLFGTDTNTVSKQTKTRFYMTQPRSSIGCVQKDFRTDGTFCANYLQTDRNKLPLEPRDLGVPSGASKIIFEPMVRSTQIEQLSCVKISTITKRTETSFHFSLVT
jgi:hypothetical protein